MQAEQGRQRNDEEGIAIPRLLTVEEVGEILGISPETVDELVAAGRLGYVRLSADKRVFTIELLAEFISGETVHRDEAWLKHCAAVDAEIAELADHDESFIQ